MDNYLLLGAWIVVGIDSLIPVTVLLLMFYRALSQDWKLTALLMGLAVFVLLFAASLAYLFNHDWVFPQAPITAEEPAK
jgi:hypothetical protein